MLKVIVRSMKSSKLNQGNLESMWMVPCCGAPPPPTEGCLIVGDHGNYDVAQFAANNKGKEKKTR